MQGQIAWEGGGVSVTRCLWEQLRQTHAEVLLVSLRCCSRASFAACGQPTRGSSCSYPFGFSSLHGQKLRLVFWEMPKCKKTIKYLTESPEIFLQALHDYDLCCATGTVPWRERWVGNGPSAPRLMYCRLMGHSGDVICKSQQEQGLDLGLSSGFSRHLPASACPGRFSADAGATRSAACKGWGTKWEKLEWRSVFWWPALPG